MRKSIHAARFLDSDILVYAFDLDAPLKRQVALRGIEEGWHSLGETTISVQVLDPNLGREGIDLQGF